MSDPRPVDEACAYDGYETAVRGFSAAVEAGDVESAQGFLADAHELRYLRVAGDDRGVQEERELDLDGLVEFVDAAGGERLRLHTLFVNSAADLGGEVVEREFLARVVDWPGLVRGDVACVDGQARLDQWLMIEAPVEQVDWPCDEGSNGACYRYDQ